MRILRRLRRTAVAALAVGAVAAGVVAGGGLAYAAAPTTAPDPSQPHDNEQVGSATSTARDPLVVVLDLSASMRDDDGAGTNKLIAAKASVERVLRQQGEGAIAGVWAYPGDDDCDPGRFVLPVAAIDDVTASVAQIDRLLADGSTPTGAALEGAVASLRSEGYDRATVLLISDGESNCSSPPCPVAEQLAGSGFDITVDAIGFQQSDAGRAELTCVANATGGRYFDAQDGDELIERLDELAGAHVTLDVRYAPRAYAGASTQLTVSVTNPSSRDAEDVRVNLAFQSEQPGDILPSVVPPTIRLGNVPAGGSVAERTWTVSTGPAGTAASAHFAVTGWAANVDAVRVAGTIDISADPVLDAEFGELLAQVRDDDRPLVILGDSYSSGQGADAYFDDSDPCHRSALTYLAPVVDAAGGSVDILACSGAVVGNLDAAQHPGTDSVGARTQLEQLAEVKDAGAVLLTFGGNDIGFADVIGACVKWGDCSENTELLGEVNRKLAGLPVSLADGYGKVWSEVNGDDDIAARGGATAPVVVLAYPQITHDFSRGSCDNFGRGEVYLTNQLVVALNATVKNAVSLARDRGYEVYFSPGVQAAFLPDHTYCADSDESYVHGISPHLRLDLPGFQDKFVRSESFHPKATGYAAETAVVMDWLGSVRRTPPDLTAARAHEASRVSAVDAWLAKTTGTSVADFTRAEAATLRQGAAVEIQASGFAPGTAASFVLHSNPRTLGTLLADSDGIVQGSLWLPAGVPLGDHTLIVDGRGADGATVRRELAVRVDSPVNVMSIVTAAAGIACLLGAGALAVIGVSARRRGLTSR